MYCFRMRRPLPQPFRRIITKEKTLVQRDSCLLFLTIRAECLRLLLLNASFRNTSALPLTLILLAISVSFSTMSPNPNPFETGGRGGNKCLFRVYFPIGTNFRIPGALVEILPICREKFSAE